MPGAVAFLGFKPIHRRRPEGVKLPPIIEHDELAPCRRPTGSFFGGARARMAASLSSLKLLIAISTGLFCSTGLFWTKISRRDTGHNRNLVVAKFSNPRVQTPA